MFVSEEFISELINNKKILHVNRAKCGKCGDCIPICPKNAIRRDNDLIVIDSVECDRCDKCIVFCKREKGNAIEEI